MDNSTLTNGKEKGLEKKYRKIHPRRQMRHGRLYTVNQTLNKIWTVKGSKGRVPQL
jgi:hypothetical protein